MRVADYIFQYLSNKGVDTVFMVSGGQAMHLNDAIYQNKEISAICTHHEQAATMCADAYGRLSGKLGVAVVTAGPGSINATTGLVGGWTDSAPMMVISGQSNLAFVKYQQQNEIRQYGVQGINIKPFVEPGTKYFITIDDPAKTLYYISKAYYYATTGRPGPVWVDVPLDIQNMEVPESLQYEFEESDKNFMHLQHIDNELILKTVQMLSLAKRPVLLVGQGVRLAGAVELFHKFISKYRIPVITSRLGIDLIESDNDLYVGRPGNYGERAANFAIQKADLIISVGCRMSSSTVGHNAKDFGRNARKIAVDIDLEELNKPGVVIDVKINADCKLFFQQLMKVFKDKPVLDYEQWIRICNYWKETYPVVLPEYKNEVPVNSYYFTDKLAEQSAAEDIVVVDTGSCFHVVCQAWKIKKGQRFLTTGGLSSMGYWAACTGACIAGGKKRTLLITGDGSLQMNLQEFATIKYNNLPIKVFIFNNNGYLLIRHTQRNFMEGRLFAEGPQTGVWCPDSLKIADAYGIKGVRISSVNEIDEKLKEVLEFDGPVICDVMTPEWQLLIPRISSDKRPDGTLVSKPFEDMFPFLSPEELKKNMEM